jgi:antirestriction protein
MTDTDTETPAAWVGCLGCYNEGKLIGKWLSDPDEIREYRCPEPVTIYNSHEELGVMDHEHMPLISGECSPVTFADAIDWLDQLDSHQPVEAVSAWLDNLGLSWRDADLADFDEAYAGEWRSEEEYAEDLAEECGLIDTDAMWPNSYIDWERAARDLFMTDCWSREAPGGVFVFRNT